MSSQPSQAKTIRDQLLAAMRTGEYAGCERLPRESVLSERLGISRTQLRDILSSLEREGFITRLQGVGTIINRHVLSARTRVDIEVEFLDMIRQNGYQADVAFVRVSEDTAGEKIAARLQVPEGTPVIRIARLCTADGRPAIYCEDIIEKALARGEYTIKDFKLPIFHFLQQFCSVACFVTGSIRSLKESSGFCILAVTVWAEPGLRESVPIHFLSRTRQLPCHRCWQSCFSALQ